MSVNRNIGLELHNGHDVGCDPRDMTADELNALGHQPMSPLKALRLRCIDCSGGSAAEVRECELKKCPAWPFRMGKNPWAGPVSEARRNQARSLADRRARLAAEQRAVRCCDAQQEVPATTLPADIADGKNHQAAEEKSARSRNGGDATPQHAERVDGGAQ